MKILERHIEAALVKRIKELGGTAEKLHPLDAVACPIDW